MFFGQPKANHGKAVFLAALSSPIQRGTTFSLRGQRLNLQQMQIRTVLIALLVLSCGPATSAPAQTSDSSNGTHTAQEAKMEKSHSEHETHQESKVIASEYPIRNPVKDIEDPMPKTNKKLLSSTMEVTVNAPQQLIWQTLINFEHYPNIFPRIDKVAVTKVEGHYVYTESILKKQLFVAVPKQVIINDLSQKPNKLRWVLLEGNFKDAHGLWELTPQQDGKSCKVRYTLASPHGPIPSAIFGWTMKMVQKDIIGDLKREAEKTLKSQANKQPVDLVSSR